MTLINSIFNQEVPVYGYRISLGQVLTTTLAIAAIAAYAIKKIWSPSTQMTLSSLSDEDFWKRIETFQPSIREDGPITVGDMTFKNLSEAQKEVALSCAGTSEYVRKYLINSSFKGAVLDLGCGIGANAIPLVAKGCCVTIIDKQKEVISKYNEVELILSNVCHYEELTQAESIIGDITIESYPANVDAVICVDTLPYLDPSQLKETMKKIYRALRPGGQFIGTIFFKPGDKNRSLIQAMQKFGAHFYPGKSVAREIISRSGFQIKNERERPSEGFFSRSICLEFLAEKPVVLNM